MRRAGTLLLILGVLQFVVLLSLSNVAAAHHWTSAHGQLVSMPAMICCIVGWKMMLADAPLPPLSPPPNTLEDDNARLREENARLRAEKGYR